MRLKSFLFLPLIVLLIGFRSPGKFVVNGSIGRPENSEATLRYLDETEGEWLTAKAQIIKGKFTFEGELNEPAKADLYIGNRTFQFYVESCEMEMEISDEYPQGFKITGSKVNDDAAILFKMTESLRRKTQETSKTIADLRELMSRLSPDSDEYKSLQRDLENIRNIHRMIFSEIQKMEADFIFNNPDSYVSLFNFRVSMQDLPIETQRKYFDNLALNLRLSPHGKRIDREIKMLENTAIGMQAPDFNVLDMNGDTVILSAYRDKSYVLLVFWGSNCVPCKASFPYVKNIYEKYSDRLNVIFISNDYKKDKWLDAIDKCDIEAWPQVLAFDPDKDVVFGSGKDEIGEKYPAYPIPIYILIDKSGKIVLRDEGFGKDSPWISQIENILKTVR